jgi:hypothetical protein
MTKALAPKASTRKVTGTGAAIEGSAPVLITEQQLIFASAAVRPKPHRGVLSWLRAITGLFSTTAADSGSGGEKKSRHVAKRYSYLENATMSREMDRL